MLRLIARGYAYKEIAKQLFISVKTVESHVSAVLRKLQLSNRHELDPVGDGTAAGLSGESRMSRAGSGPGCEGFGSSCAGSGPGGAGDRVMRAPARC
ncbi:hypothetical protein SMICM304S_05232 [Streptomyces microflavus]